MVATEQSKTLEQVQRIRVELETNRDGRRVKIRVESHDDRLGWYTAGSLAVPLSQLPLLEQAVAEMRSCQSADEAEPDNIIPFPG
jgi:hypothetical protein